VNTDAYEEEGDEEEEEEEEEEELAAPAPPPRLPTPPPQHVDVKWVGGQGERCTRSNGVTGPRGTGRTGWRCASAAVPGSTLCANHAAYCRAASIRARSGAASIRARRKQVEEEEEQEEEEEEPETEDVEDDDNLNRGTVSREADNPVTHPAGTSQFKGVFWVKGVGKWKARFKEKHLGCHATEEAAAQAYNNYVKAGAYNRPLFGST